ncbi:MAG: fibrillarin-like pre-rRNA processing protein [Candidatus Woesearchaeota archaeon]|jgi:fibrillarin-like pre-rRNA processing protein
MRQLNLQGVFEFRTRLYTKNMVKGMVVYGEQLFTFDGTEYRNWDPTRSKLGAAIKKGTSQIGIRPGSRVLYLGCSTGTTVSHVSDIVGEKGVVYAVDIAPRVMRDMILLSEKRGNIIPIVADASRPVALSQYVGEVDVVFMDIAQRNQVEIFLKCVEAFCKKGGFSLLSFKSRSVDITVKPKILYQEARREIEKELTIVDYRTLDPYEADHAFFVCKK